MTSTDNQEPVHEALVRLLDAGGARFRVLQHAHAGRSEEVARVRHTEVGQGAKALVCRLHLPDGATVDVLAVMPADRQLDKQKLAAGFGAQKVKLLSVPETEEITRCQVGAIPPFVFDERLRLVCDPGLPKRYEVIAFNAGLLDRSILLHTDDYLRLARPRLLDIAGEQ